MIQRIKPITKIKNCDTMVQLNPLPKPVIYTKELNQAILLYQEQQTN